MICILLVAGHDALQGCEDPEQFEQLEGVPKALLPGVGGKKILDCWWDIIKTRRLFSQVYMVCNADKFRHFEYWASSCDFPVDHIINDGTTSFQYRLGAVADLDLALKIKVKEDEDFVVIAGDMLFQDDDFDINLLSNYFQSKRQNADLLIYYQLRPEEPIESRCIIEMDPSTNRILRFLENPSPDQTKSRNASVVFYFFRSDVRNLISLYLQHHTSVEQRSMGQFMTWLINDQKRTLLGMKVPSGFQLVDQSWLQSSTGAAACWQRPPRTTPLKITKKAFARVGLMGNPSDGFNGKTISLSIKNFWAQVTICESGRLLLTPNPLCDPTQFGSLADLHNSYCKDGYFGGLRLLQATCKQFYDHCCKHGIALARRNFTLRYETNIPRQVGLAGSSAIVTATLKCLMDFYNLTEADLPKQTQPKFILDVEKSELHINAGLQDRVIQVYEGLVFMDFSKEIMQHQGHGEYSYIRLKAPLPKMFIAYVSDPSDSGKIHDDVFGRWKRGDQDVMEAMAQFAQLTDEAKMAIEDADWPRLADLMKQNFETRRSIYGDHCLGPRNLKMIEIGSSFGAACKFPGSGGAILGLLLDCSKYSEMKDTFLQEGFVFADLIYNFPNSTS